MFNNFTKALVFLFILCLPKCVTAQAPDSLKQKDSINTALLNSYAKIAAMEQQHIADSIKQVEIENQLSHSKASDTAKLQQQLQSIKDAEDKRIAEKKQQLNELRSNASAFPVHGFFKDTLFLIYNRLGSFSAQERAAAIEARIQNLAGNFRFKKDSLKIDEEETAADISFGETVIISITDNDAIVENTSKDALANHYKEIIGNAVLHYKSETGIATLAKEIGLALLVVIALGFVIFYLTKGFKWIASKIQLHEGKRIQGIKLKNYTLLDAKAQVNALLIVLNIVKWILILLLIYIALPILFGIFPWTKNFAATLFGYILSPLKKMGSGIWNYLPNLITIIVIVVVFRYILKLLHFFKIEIEKGSLHLPGFYPDWANPTYQIIKIVVYAFMAILIFPYLPGSNSPVFQGVSVFLGVLFTFGSSGSLSNVVAGLVLTYMRLFKIGDRVKIGEVTGDVIEKSMLVTRIRTIKNEIISIPNSTVMSSHTINYSSEVLEKGLILHTTVTIGYDVPWKNMHQALLNAADRTALLLKDPAPFVLQTSLDDFYVSYQVNAYTNEASKQSAIYSELHSHIQDCCNEVGIEIMSPHYRAARDGNTTTIPPDYLSSDYKAPGFSININKENT